VSEWYRGFDVIAILSTDACALEDASIFKFGEDVLYGAFGDTDLSGDFANDHGGILPEQHENVGMVGEKGPAGLLCWRLGWKGSNRWGAAGVWGSGGSGHTATAGIAGGGLSDVCRG